MNKRKLLLPGLLAMTSLQAQIIITSADMPNVNDTIVISVNTGLSNFHPDSTGANYVWDYSKLVPDSQRTVKFVGASQTPYSFFNFLSSYGTRNYTPDQFPFSLTGTPPQNAYDFYKKSIGAYNMVGEGLTVSGTSVPEINNPVDRVYKLPMTFGQIDSSSSKAGFPIPGMGYYAKKQKRVNVVDGWGTLITPYGTFNTLRIKSTLTIVDSIYIDTVHAGFNIPRAIQYEYKWLGNGKKIPLLEVDATAAGTGNAVTVNRANWQDSALKPMTVTLLDQNTCPIVQEGFINAVVSGGRYPLTYSWSTGQTTDSIGGLPPGTYSLTVTDRYGRVVKTSDTILVLPDSVCNMTIDFTVTNTCPMTKDGSISTVVNNGRAPLKYAWSSGDTTAFLNQIGPGSYTLTVTDKYNRTVQSVATVLGYYQYLNCLNIPTAFTPDGDGVNDTWRIRSLSDFPHCSVEIFNQWGSLVFRSSGYGTPWDGRYNGEPAPAGAYYFVIDLGDHTNKFSGTVTIIR